MELLVNLKIGMVFVTIQTIFRGPLPASSSSADLDTHTKHETRVV